MMRSPIVHMAAAVAACLLATGVARAAEALPSAFAHGDAKQGKTLAERDCVACHARQMGGDADKMYSRAERRVKTPEQLIAQVRYCNTQLGTNYFPEEEEHVAAYLNERFYKFKP